MFISKPMTIQQYDIQHSKTKENNINWNKAHKYNLKRLINIMNFRAFSRFFLSLPTQIIYFIFILKEN